MRTLSALWISESLANFLRREATDLSKCSLWRLYSFWMSASTLADSVWQKNKKQLIFAVKFVVYDSLVVNLELLLCQLIQNYFV